MRIIGIVLLLSLAFVPNTTFATAPGIAGTLSVIPGLGQVSNGDFLEGVGWFSVVVGGVLAGGLISYLAFDLWMYNMYDAFRDAGAQKSTKYSLFENYFSTFNPANIVDPIGAPILVLSLGRALVSKSRGSTTLSPNAFVSPFIYGFVGLGEEGLFRGFLFPGFSDVFSSKFFGALVSSALFSAAHIIGGTAVDRTTGALGVRFFLGMLFAWQTDLNRYDLRKSIFTHAWYDIIIDWDRRGLLALDGSKLSNSFVYGLKVSIPF